MMYVFEIREREIEKIVSAYITRTVRLSPALSSGWPLCTLSLFLLLIVRRGGGSPFLGFEKQCGIDFVPVFSFVVDASRSRRRQAFGFQSLKIHPSLDLLNHAL